MLDYASIKTAVAALSPQPASNEAAAASLNAQTQTLPAQDVPSSSIRSVLLLSVSFDWAKLVAFAAKPLSDPIGLTGASDPLIAVCVTAMEAIGNTTTFAASNAAAWGAIEGMLAVLVSAGVISSASETALLALRTPPAPAWPVVLTAADIATALAQ
jgi:hypothetical protein